MAKSPFKIRYHMQNPLGYIYLRALDFLTAFFPKRRMEKYPPQKILICSYGHLGDVVLATSVIPAIKKRYPKSVLGFVVGSWSSSILENHPDVDHLHIVDHWKLNRCSSSFWRKWKQYRKTKKRTLKELRELNYDVAFDLYGFYPNAAFLLWQAKIGNRIGYSSGGNRALYTTCFTWEKSHNFILNHYFQLLHSYDQKLALHENVKPDLQHLIDPKILKFQSLEKKGRYVVFHIGAGSREKLWEQQKWRALAEKLCRNNESILFTGHGSDEKQQVDAIISGIKGTFNSCNQLSMSEFCTFIKNAKAVISTETVTPHISLAYNIPTVVLANPNHFSPLWFSSGANRSVIPICADCRDAESEVQLVFQAYQKL